MTPQPLLQPALHHLVSCVHAPAVTMSAASGRIDRLSAAGSYLGERRLLCTYALSAFDRVPELIHSVLDVDGTLRISAIVRDGTEDTPDPVLLLRLVRHAHATGFVDTITIENMGQRFRDVPVMLALACDLASTSGVKAGLVNQPLVPGVDCAGGINFARDGYAVDVTATQPARVDIAAGTISWDVRIEAGGSWSTIVEMRGEQPDDGAFRPGDVDDVSWIRPTVVTDSASLRLIVDWSFSDLGRLALSDPLERRDIFIAAGCPWYFTLFGRDSLWTARMMLPFGQDLAGSTLRCLARRQGQRVDASAAEQPGRIPHEVRPAALSEGAMTLPPVYYGSVDATPLWITTLAEAWRWGLAEGDVVALLPALQAAVEWLVTVSDADDDGLCEYVDDSGTGLSNQGWKDSGDSINWHDGTAATAPIALVEVQGYAYEAAINAVQLYEHFRLPGSERISAFAHRLRNVFHDHFWITDAQGPHLAVALDADKRAVDSITSNPGHVLGTGLLDSEQEATVIARLLTDLDCGVGLRTMSIGDGRYNPVSYHNGSIWPHDTAICARGMVLAGHPQAAGTLLAGLIEAAVAFDGRLPELFASIDDAARIVPYLASCRPQAWAAAVGPTILWALAPLVPRRPGEPPQQLAGIDIVGDVDLDGFRISGQRVRIAIRSGVVSYLTPVGQIPPA